MTNKQIQIAIGKQNRIIKAAREAIEDAQTEIARVQQLCLHDTYTYWTNDVRVPTCSDQAFRVERCLVCDLQVNGVLPGRITKERGVNSGSNAVR